MNNNNNFFLSSLTHSSHHELWMWQSLSQWLWENLPKYLSCVTLIHHQLIPTPHEHRLAQASKTDLRRSDQRVDCEWIHEVLASYGGLLFFFPNLSFKAHDLMGLSQWFHNGGNAVIETQNYLFSSCRCYQSRISPTKCTISKFHLIDGLSKLGDVW